MTRRRALKWIGASTVVFNLVSACTATGPEDGSRDNEEVLGAGGRHTVDGAGGELNPGGGGRSDVAPSGNGGVGPDNGGPGGVGPGGAEPGVGGDTADAASGGSSVAPSILQSAAKWIDAELSDFITADAIAPSLRPGFTSAFGGLSLSNIEGPESEPGIRVTDDAASSNRAIWCSELVPHLSWGYVDIRARVRWYDGQHAWFGPGLSTFEVYTSYPYGLGPSELLPTATAAYRHVSPRRYISHSNEAAFGDWRDIRFEANASDETGLETNLAKVLGFRQSGVQVGKSNVVLDVASLTISQSRVAMAKDVRDASAAYVEMTNNRRLVRAPDVWLAKSAALMESWGGQGKLRLLDPESTPATTIGVFHFNAPIPIADANAITVGDVSLKVGTSGTWRIVQGSTDVDTGYPVASVPICVGMVLRTTTVELWIDGQLQYEAVMSGAGAGLTVLGGAAEGSLRSLATFDDPLDPSDIASASTQLRLDAHLPASWPITIWTGQSNSVHDNATQGTLAASGARSIPGYAFRRYEIGFKWRTGAPIDYKNASENYSLGGSWGWFKAAQAAGDPAVIVVQGKGGASSNQWLSGEEMYIKTRDTGDDALATLGTPLGHIDTWVWIQGESEAGNSPATYLSNLRAIRTWVREKWGPQVKWIGLFLNTNATATYGDEVRSIQAEFAMEDTGTVYTAHNVPLVDAFHYDTAGEIGMGEALYAAGASLR